MSGAVIAAIDLIIGVEGPPSDDPRDPGGATFYGHDQASWPDTLLRCPPDVHAQLPVHVRDLTREQAVLAYEYAYIIFYHCDQMPAPLTLLFFDALVNQGQGWAPSAFQSAVGAGPDGTIGKATVAAANSCDLQTAVADFAHARDDRYRADPQFSIYGKGWLRRLFHILLVCLTYDTVPATIPAHVP
jgi:lysozyme family protein